LRLVVEGQKEKREGGSSLKEKKKPLSSTMKKDGVKRRGKWR